jgi:hypothetical protein
MTDNRKSDFGPCTKFRPNRFFKNGGKWYFNTREGSTEGPFEYRYEAEESLETYIKIVNSGFYADAGKLTLEPLESPEI